MLVRPPRRLARRRAGGDAQRRAAREREPEVGISGQVAT